MNKITGLVIALVVGGLLVGGLLIPTVQGMTATEKTFENDGGFYRMAEISADDTEEYTIYWEKSNTTHLLINGVDFDAFGEYGSAITTVVASDSWLLRYNSTTSQYGYLQYFDGTTWMGDDATTKSMEFTASGGSAVLTRVSTTDQTTTKNVSYQYMYAIMPNSTDDIMKKPTQTPYVKGDSEIYAMGLTSNMLFQISGNIDDGVTVDILGISDEVISNLAVNKTAVAGYKDLYVVSSITFDYTISGTTASATYNYFIVPYKVTAELSQHMDATQIAMFGVISILGIVALVVVAANGIRNKY